MERPTNRLAGETSPYLLQHAHNPVDWYPWGPEALERAQREDKPIFLSIGYAACHWCHVMEHESFESAEIAAYLNAHFVSIKVDREERPDLDDIYMAATTAMSGSGGWPMSVFLAPDQRPFFAGTYFPPQDRWGRIGFLPLLRRLVDLWETQRPALLDQAEQLTAHVREQSTELGAQTIGESNLERVVVDLEASFEPKFGGFGRAPKFPPHQALELLQRHYYRTGERHALEMVIRTLDGMKNGGIYDHVGGGFARYSTDERWLVPHFEKMLYDNAQLAVAYLHGFQATGDTEYQRVARETLDYVVREMQGPDGGYYSATDADSEGEEGKFFVFSPDEIQSILDAADAEAFCLYYDITPQGNWEGKSVLNTPRSLESVAEELATDPELLAERLSRARDKVYAARKQRVPPLLDDKVLTAWNGLMIGAMAEGYHVLRDSRYLASAERAAEFLSRELMREDFSLLRTTRAGRAHTPGFLQDYAYLADGLLSLYETTGDLRWLSASLGLAQRIVQRFGNAEGAFFHNADDNEPLIARVREGHDGALPNPNAVAARVLTRLSFHYAKPELLERALSAITGYGGLIERSPRAFATTLNLVDLLLEGPTELVVVGERHAPDTEALLADLGRRFIPNRLMVLVDPSTPNPTPLASGKGPIHGHAALYVCRNYTCKAPVTRLAEIAAALDLDRSDRVRGKRVGV